MKWVFRFLLGIWLLLAGPIMMLIFGQLNLEGDWTSANRRSARIAPDPVTHFSTALIQVYAARTWSWRGAFAIHTWFAVKEKQSKIYETYQVIGWRQYRGEPILVIEADVPDRYWFGQKPWLLLDLRGGNDVDHLVTRIKQAANNYPYRETYRTWPGPNSNTFTAFIARQIPELHLDLPPTAIGKDFLPPGKVIAPSPSQTGFQLSFYGLAGVTLGFEEGVEFNMLTLNFGLDPFDLALKLPGIGRVGGLKSFFP